MIIISTVNVQVGTMVTANRVMMCCQAPVAGAVQTGQCMPSEPPQDQALLNSSHCSCSRVKKFWQATSG